jgi:hypothetical protein
MSRRLFHWRHHYLLLGSLAIGGRTGVLRGGKAVRIIS